MTYLGTSRRKLRNVYDRPPYSRMAQTGSCLKCIELTHEIEDLKRQILKNNKETTRLNRAEEYILALKTLRCLL